MEYYFQLEKIQQELDNAFAKEGKEITQDQALFSMYEHREYDRYRSNLKLIESLCNLDPEDFLEKKDKLYLARNSEVIIHGMDWYTGHGISLVPDVTVFFRHAFFHEKIQEYQHSNFEVDYVYKGVYRIFYDTEERILNDGDVILISPQLRHQIEQVQKESFLIRLYINYQTFESAFLSLLSEQDVIADFFKTILTNSEQPNYLLLSTGNSASIHHIAQQMYLECFRYDEYSPQCTVNWLKLFFSYTIRYYSDTFRLSSSGTNVDFRNILKYMEQNYKSVTLSEVAEKFHYTVSHMSVMIKKITNHSYTELIRAFRMNEAGRYLENSNLSVEEVCFRVGYNNIGHFTRTFHAYFGMPPCQYRNKAHKREGSQ